MKGSKLIKKVIKAGNKKSKVNIDYRTALLQSKALNKIFSNIIDKDMDIFFLENKEFLNSKEVMSAKGAAIKGFGQLCRKKYFDRRLVVTWRTMAMEFIYGT